MEFGASYVEPTPPPDCAAIVTVRAEADIRFALQWIAASGSVSAHAWGEGFSLEGPGVVVVTGLRMDASSFDPELFDPVRPPFAVEVESGCSP